MNMLRTAMFWAWGGSAVILAGFLLYGAGYILTVSAPHYPYGEPRGAGVAWTGVVFLALGMGLVMMTAALKALKVGLGRNPPDDGPR